MNRDIAIIAKELGGTTAEAKEFVQRIHTELDESVSTSVILSALKMIEPRERRAEQTVNKVAHRIWATQRAEELTAVGKVMELLGTDKRGVALLREQIRSVLGYDLTNVELLNALHAIRQDSQLPLSIREQYVLEALPLAQQKMMHRKTWNIGDADLTWLVPDFRADEKWLDNQRLDNIVGNLADIDVAPDPRKIRGFGQRCWTEIKRTRSYAVPSRGRAEVLASAELTRLIQLVSIRFQQENVEAPAVLIRFEFRDPSCVGIVRVDADGTVHGFHESIRSSLFRAIIDATALSYYRDLVTPGKTYFYERHRRRIPKHIVHDRSHKKTDRSPRTLPRSRGIAPPGVHVHELDEWYFAQERARHSVIGHRRWVGKDFRADAEKQAQARRAGITLEPGYTWVIEHERGKGEAHGVKLNGLDLAERTLFAPPIRATKELRGLLKANKRSL